MNFLIVQQECKDNTTHAHTGSTRSLTDSSIASKSEESNDDVQDPVAIEKTPKNAIPVWNEDDLQEFIQAARSIATSPPPTPTWKPYRVLSVIPSLDLHDISSSCPGPSLDTSLPPSMDIPPSMDTSLPPSMDTSLPFGSPRPVMIHKRPKLNSAYFPEISVLRSGLTARSDVSTDDCGSWCCTQSCLHSVFLPVHMDREEDEKPVPRDRHVL